MTFKTKEELFGDNAGFGAQVPFSTTAPPGTGSGNRGVNVGEQITAAISNRPHYALALNDEDLNNRLAPFEADGLDASYRLGSIATAGGGAEITVDGRAVELRTAMTTQYIKDLANAALRITNDDDSASGGVGLDITGLSHGFGLVERRIKTFNTSNTILTSVQAGTLNEGNNDSGSGTVAVTTPGSKFQTSGVTELINRTDLIEILTPSNYRGLYVLWGFAQNGSFDKALLQRLDRSTSPTFTANTACTFRVCRPILFTTKTNDASFAIDHHPLAEGLTIEFPKTHTDGYPIFKARMWLGTTADTLVRANIDSRGAFSNTVGRGIALTGDFDEVGKYWGAPSYISNPSFAGTYDNHFLAFNHNDGATHFNRAFLNQERRQPIGSVTVNAASASSITIDITGDSSYRILSPGQLIEIRTLLDEPYGIFNVFSSSNDGSTVTANLETLGGQVPTLTPAANYLAYFLEGTTIGRTTWWQKVGGTLPFIDSLGASYAMTHKNRASAIITTPKAANSTDHAQTALTLVSLHNSKGILLRGTDQDLGDAFMISGVGDMTLKGGLRAAVVASETHKYESLQVVTDRVVSMINAVTDDTAVWARGFNGSVTPYWQLTAGSSDRSLYVSLSFLPRGATITNIGCWYDTNGAWLDNKVRFELVSLSFDGNTPPVIHEFVNLNGASMSHQQVSQPVSPVVIPTTSSEEVCLRFNSALAPTGQLKIWGCNISYQYQTITL